MLSYDHGFIVIAEAQLTAFLSTKVREPVVNVGRLDYVGGSGGFTQEKSGNPSCKRMVRMGFMVLKDRTLYQSTFVTGYLRTVFLDVHRLPCELDALVNSTMNGY